MGSLFHDHLGRPLTPEQSAARIVGSLLNMWPLVAVLAFNVGMAIVGIALWRTGRWVLSLPAWVIAGGALAALAVAWGVLGREKMLQGMIYAGAGVAIFGPAALFVWWLASH